MKAARSVRCCCGLRISKVHNTLTIATSIVREALADSGVRLEGTGGDLILPIVPPKNAFGAAGVRVSVYR
ncbi:MAG: hypothetical protein M2R45_00577 [Verrucomicrobia subdivision 3 bacterium]|nr:hypothetical protein [Limisphaerales bacterium]MCS1413546.1 hypothetical protein [Limisphaerales bacterium]